MSVAQALLQEFEAQAPVTRRFLERLPEDKLGWKPHTKSMSAGQLALHLAQIPGGIVRFVSQSPAQAPNFQAPEPQSVAEILKAFDESVQTVKTTLPEWTDERMSETWQLLQGEKELFAMPRGAALRVILLNHWYQHRGQFGVYLRLLDVPVPASFGPSADEKLL